MTERRETASAAWRAPTRLVLSAAWTRLMAPPGFGDSFTIAMPGKVDAMADGRLGPLGAATPLVLVSSPRADPTRGVLTFQAARP